MSISSTSKGPCGSTSRVHFYDEDRYVTDCGPQCSNHCAEEGRGLWVYIVKDRFASALGQCASCHEIVTFALDRSGDGTAVRPTITEVKASHRRYLTKCRAKEEK